VRELWASLIGVPAAILCAAGLGIVVVTVASRLLHLSDTAPIRWAHAVFGVGVLGAGVLLLQLDVSLIGLR
jgi:uncharacterized membrane protein YhiD involved in acid resistance